MDVGPLASSSGGFTIALAGGVFVERCWLHDGVYPSCHAQCEPEASERKGEGREAVKPPAAGGGLFGADC
jgi:hypothetical protein